MNPLAAYFPQLLQAAPGRGNPLIAEQAMMDNAPIGAVGAPGGLLQANSAPTGRDPVLGLLGTASYLPGIGGDVLGPAADLRMFQKQPESRTLGNAALFGLGLLPAIPSLAYMMGRKVEPGRMAQMFPSQAGMTGYHGSPHKFDKFDITKIGTGEGAQAYGHGLYIAENPRVAKEYSTRLGGANIVDVDKSLDKKTAESLIEAVKASSDPEGYLVSKADQLKDIIARGDGDSFDIKLEKQYRDAALAAKNKRYNVTSPNFYHVDLPDEHIAKMLDWDKPLSEQPESVRKALLSADEDTLDSIGFREGAQYSHETEMGPWELKNQTGADLYSALVDNLGGKEKASAKLHALGIPGIKYLDAGSRGAGKGTRNFVVFDDSILKILKRE